MNGRPRAAWLPGRKAERAAVARDDLMRYGESQPRAALPGLRGEEWLARPADVGEGYSGARVLDDNFEVLAAALRLDANIATRLARLAGVKEEVDDGVLESLGSPINVGRAGSTS